MRPGTMIHVDVLLRGRTVGTYRVDAPQARVGRDADNQVRLEGLGVTARHCVIERTPGGGWAIEDLSGGWTQLDGAIVRGRRLAPDGARLGVGVFELTYGWVEPAPAPEPAPTPAIVDEPPRIARFEVLRELGAGGMGVVVAARDPASGREVAIKLLRDGRRASARARARFEREARVLARLDHPHVVRVHEVGEHEGAPFLVMELVEGESLEERLVRQGPLPLAAALAIVEPVARALAHAHQHDVLHRDVKPANVLLRAAAAPSAEVTPLLTDFGLAKELALDHDHVGTAPATGLGTPGFLSPEQLTDARSVTATADVFGLGATLYAAVVGAPPFVGATLRELLLATCDGRWTRPSKVRPELPVLLDAVLERCLAVDVVDRYECALALADDLARLARGDAPRTSRPPGPIDALQALMDQELDEPPAATAPDASSPASSPPDAPANAEPANAEPADDAPVVPPAPEPPHAAPAARVRLHDPLTGPAPPGATTPPPAHELDELVARARERFAGDEVEAAISLFDQALALAPERADLWTMRAVARRRAGDERGALADHAEALRRDPDDVGARVGRGLIRLRMRDYARAARDLERALRKLPPGSSRARRVRRALERARAGLGDTVVRGVDLDRDSGEGPTT